MSEEWFVTIESDDGLCQGDILFGFPVPLVKESHFDAQGRPTDFEASIEYFNVIILSQTCDLQTNKIDSVLMAALATKSDFEAYPPGLKASVTKETIRRGYHHHLFLLDQLDEADYPTIGHQMVNFRKIFSVPLRYVETQVLGEKRPRMTPPYRENLSQAFAKFIMRIALEKEIPSFAR